MIAAPGVLAQSNPGPTNATSTTARPPVPDARELVASFRPNEMRVVTQRYQSDRGNLTRYYNLAMAPDRYARLKSFGSDWLAAVQKLDPNRVSEEARAERTRLLETIQRDLRHLDEQAQAQAEIAPLIPFAWTIIELDQKRRRVEKVDPPAAAGVVDKLAKRIAQTRQSLEAGSSTESGLAAFKANASLGGRASETVNALRTALRGWFNFYNDYDPLFTWWLAQPYKEADKALEDYARALGQQSAPAAGRGTNDVALASRFTPPSVRMEKLAGKTPQVPDLNELTRLPQSRMRAVVERYQGNRGGRRGGGGGGRSGVERLQSREFYQDWLVALQKLDFDSLTRDDQVNYLLLRNRVEYQLRRTGLRNETDDDTGTLLPFEATIEKLGEQQAQAEKFDATQAIEFLQGLKRELETARQSAVEQFEQGDAALAVRAGRANRPLAGLRNQLQDWFDRNSADWSANEAAGAAYKSVDQALEDYGALLREKSGTTARRDGSDIVARPIGREALDLELAGEMISYTPEELLAIADKEFAWCVAEMKVAAREMGLGDDWRRAVEKVKEMHVPVGEQPYLIRDLAWEAVDYLERKDLITIPEIARETWRLQMMSLSRQMVNPFFTGGETISVSYPLSAMSHDQKLQSMRGNNIPFARATVFHELIPGHELQGFASARYHTERRAFSTSFYGEGWAVYWEMLLYERGFPGTPQNRIGALFWRLHRCARIVFSLNFHLGKWTPQQCIDYLVDPVGHERDNATAEVRRSFVSSYRPLYQASYLLGALQLRRLHQELVSSGRMTDKAFHDAVLLEGSMPIALLRADLTRQKLSPDFRPDWRFYDAAPVKDRTEVR